MRHSTERAARRAVLSAFAIADSATDAALAEQFERAMRAYLAPPSRSSDIGLVDIALAILRDGQDPDRGLVFWQRLTDLGADFSCAIATLERLAPSARQGIGVTEQEPAALAGFRSDEPSRPAPNATLTSLPVRPAAREILLLAFAIASARGVADATALDVLLACLVRPEYTTLDRAELAGGATAAVVRALPEPADEGIAAALRATGVDRSKVDLSDRGSIDDPHLRGIVSAADELGRHVGATELWAHHVVAAALVQPLPRPVLDALGVDEGRLRTALRAAIDLRWPNESRQAWDSVLGQAPNVEVHPDYWDRMFTIDTLGSQGISGLAVLIDESTALTLSRVVSSVPFVQLEALGTPLSSQARVVAPAAGHKGDRIALLEPFELHELQSKALQLESITPAPNTPVEIVGLDASGNPLVLRGVAGATTGPDLVIHASEPLASDLVLAGAPILADGRVVGLASAFSAEQIFVVPSGELLRAMERRVREESALEHPVQVEISEEAPENTATEIPEVPAEFEPEGTEESPRALTSSALALIAAAMYVHGDQPGPIEFAEVLLGGLGDASSGEVGEELTALWAAVPDAPTRIDRVRAAIAVIGSAATFPRESSASANAVDPSGALATEPDEAMLASLITDSRALDSRLGSSGPIDVRHLLAVVLGRTATIPALVETALGLTADVLRQALRDAVRRTALGSGEPEEAWDELLRADEPTLVSSFDSDLVAWDDARQLQDHLAIENYVNMLSLVVASTDTPLPLSIGLFGPWGSGKTYFMGLMRQAIKRLADQAVEDRTAGRDPISCARIVPITFNAWHYADANLWASLAVRIFDELAGREKEKRTELDKQRQGLIEKLRIYRELETELSEESARAHDRAKQLEGRLTKAREQQRRAEETLTGLKVSDVVQAAKNDPRLQQLWTRTAEEIRQLGISPDIDKLTETAAELDAAAKDARRLRTALRGPGRVRALALIVPFWS
jgi:hypothetical protein